MTRIASQALRAAIFGTTPTPGEMNSRLEPIPKKRKPRKPRPKRIKNPTPVDCQAQGEEMDRMAETDR